MDNITDAEIRQVIDTTDDELLDMFGRCGVCGDPRFFSVSQEKVASLAIRRGYYISTMAKLDCTCGFTGRRI